MTTQSHHDHVEKQFSSQASEYLTSTVHASGRDLQRLAVRLADYPDASVLDMGCGAGHASFVAAQNVSAVVAYDLSAHMPVSYTHLLRQRHYVLLGRGAFCKPVKVCCEVCWRYQKCEC